MVKEIKVQPGYFVTAEGRTLSPIHTLFYGEACHFAAQDSIGCQRNVVRPAVGEHGDRTVARFVNGEAVFPF